MSDQYNSEYLNGWSKWSDLYFPHDFEVATLKSLFPNLNKFCVLEIGCGDGRVTKRLDGHCKKITAIDIDHSLVNELSKSNSSSLEYRKMSGTNLELPDKYFDLVIFSWSLHQMKPMIEPLKEAFRCLKNYGHVVIFGLTKRGQYDDVVEKFGKNPGHHLTQEEEFSQSVTTVFGKPKIERKIGDNSEFGFKFDDDETAIRNWFWSLKNWHSYDISANDEDKLLAILKEYKRDKGYFLDIYGTLVVAQKQT